MKLSKLLSYPTVINEYLLLGSVNSLQRKELKDYPIAYVISVMKNPPSAPQFFSSSVEQLIISIEDSKDEDIARYFPAVFSYIRAAKEQQKYVLIHCEQGMSRSASFVIAWLMHEQNLQGEKVNYKDTLRSLVKLRSVVAPNAGFDKQLESYERELNFSGPQLLLTPETLSEILNFLSPMDLFNLSRTNRFFRGYIASGSDSIWKKHLLQLSPSLKRTHPVVDSQAYSLQAIYKACFLLKKKGFQDINIFTLRGFFGEQPGEILPKEEFKHILLGAIHGFQLTLVKRLIAIHAHYFAEFLETSITHAVATDNMPLLRHLETHYPAINWKFLSSNGNTLLHTAAHHGSYDAFDFLYKRKKINPKLLNHAGATLLEQLSYSNSTRLAMYILENIPTLDPMASNHSHFSAIKVAEIRHNKAILEIYKAWPTKKSESEALSI